MPNWKIHVLDTAGFHIDKSILTYLTDPGKMVECITPIFYLEGPKKILVDTSISSVETAQKLSPGTDTWRRPDQEVAAVLATIGVQPREVEIVVLTHLHFDHCGSNSLFPQARFLVQRQELRYAAAPDPAQETAYMAASIGMQADYAGTKFEPVDGEVEIAPGVRVVPVPGHTPGSQAILVQSSRKVWALAGDLIPIEENLRRMVPAGIHTELASWYASARMIAARADVVIPGHDKGYLGCLGG